MDHHNFKHLTSVAQKARTCIGLVVVLSCAVALRPLIQQLIWPDMHTMEYLERNPTSELHSYLLYVGIAGVCAEIIAQLFAIFFFLKWEYAAISNAKQLNPKVMKTSAKTALWSWFVPVWCMFKPYFVMKEIWAATLNTSDTSGITQPLAKPISDKLLSWWLFWWLPKVGLFFLATILPNGPTDLAKWALALVTVLALIASGILAIHIITEITIGQDKAFAQRKCDETDGAVEKVSADLQDTNATDSHTIHQNKPNVVER